MGERAVNDVKHRILSRRARLVAVALVSCGGASPAKTATIDVAPPPQWPHLPVAAPDPIVDRDADGFPDKDDACPDLPGPDRGCPARPCLSIIMPSKIAINARIVFAASSTNVLPASTPILEDVARVLTEHPEMRVRLEGHTDPTEAAALGLSRAQAVRNVLVKRGVDLGRLEVAGFSATRPRAPNSTTAGRDENRRVEFVTLE
jgi:outer membrane protein OmpA-like peptidoglycan-associated protein